MPRLRRISSPFRALTDRNYRLYFSGQAVSASGTQMQRVAQAWLVLDLTGSPVALGLVTALQYLPILGLSLTAGVFIDRLPKRGVLVATQIGALVQAAALAALTLSATVQLWHVYVLALMLGCVNAFDNTTRNSFVSEMVEHDHVQSAVSLNSSIQNLARIAGPAVGGIVVATAGPGWCFLVNAVSYVAVLISLAMMRSETLHATAAFPGRILSQIADGVRHASGVPELRLPLIVQVFIGTFGLNFIVVLPLLARFAFDAGPVGLGALNAAQGIGAIVGSLIAGSAGRPVSTGLLWAAAAFGALLLSVGVAPSLLIGLVLMVFMGVAQVYYSASAQTTLQLAARAEYRGRILSLWTLLTAGVTPVGATFTGALADTLGIRAAIAINGALCMIGAGTGWAIDRRRTRLDGGIARSEESVP